MVMLQQLNLKNRYLKQYASIKESYSNVFSDFLSTCLHNSSELVRVLSSGNDDITSALRQFSDGRTFLVLFQILQCLSYKTAA